MFGGVVPPITLCDAKVGGPVANTPEGAGIVSAVGTVLSEEEEGDAVGKVDTFVELVGVPVAVDGAVPSLSPVTLCDVKVGCPVADKLLGDAIETIGDEDGKADGTSDPITVGMLVGI